MLIGPNIILHIVFYMLLSSIFFPIFSFPYTCCYCYSYRYYYYYYNTVALEKLSLHSLRTRRHHLDASFFFFVRACRGLKSCTSLLENVSIRIPARHPREFSMFNVCTSNKYCPSARCVYAANVVGKDLDIFAVGAVSLIGLYLATDPRKERITPLLGHCHTNAPKKNWPQRKHHLCLATRDAYEY
jgi:hypothetical protein